MIFPVPIAKTVTGASLSGFCEHPHLMIFTVLIAKTVTGAALSEFASHPHLMGFTDLIAKTVRQPASQPAIQAASKPARQLGGQPARQPASQTATSPQSAKDPGGNVMVNTIFLKKIQEIIHRLQKHGVYHCVSAQVLCILGTGGGLAGRLAS